MIWICAVWGTKSSNLNLNISKDPFSSVCEKHFEDVSAFFTWNKIAKIKNPQRVKQPFLIFTVNSDFQLLYTWVFTPFRCPRHLPVLPLLISKNPVGGLNLHVLPQVSWILPPHHCRERKLPPVLLPPRLSMSFLFFFLPWETPRHSLHDTFNPPIMLHRGGARQAKTIISTPILLEHLSAECSHKKSKDPRCSDADKFWWMMRVIHFLHKGDWTVRVSSVITYMCICIILLLNHIWVSQLFTS